MSYQIGALIVEAVYGKQKTIKVLDMGHGRSWSRNEKQYTSIDLDTFTNLDTIYQVGIDEELRVLVRQMLDENPVNRPSLEKIVEKLKLISGE